ncbi:MAG: BrnT family toxin [Deltaproteobacteria bacterium]|nr:BrnT family toxin [Deltaproteobacteria bacterium]
MDRVDRLADPNAVEAADLLEPGRNITVGWSALWRVLFVVHTEAARNGRTRIIGARKASPAQRRK